MQTTTFIAAKATALPAAGEAPSFFKLDAISAFAAAVFGIICIFVAVFMAWRAKKAKISENGTILGNLGLAAVAFVIGAGSLALPFAKSIVGFFTNTSL